MITQASNEFPEIEWDDLRTELLESDIDERMEVYIAIGVGKDGKQYKGNAVFFCDELEKIEHIEEAQLPEFNSDKWNRCEKELYIEKYYGKPIDSGARESVSLISLVDLICGWEQSQQPYSSTPSKQECLCEHCGDPIEHPICKSCEIDLTLPDNEY